jgi:tektin-4
LQEVALTYEVRDVMTRLLTQMEEQLVINKAAKQDLEMDWSDKKEAHAIDSVNIGLKNNSPTILFKPGATRIPEG